MTSYSYKDKLHAPESLGAGGELKSISLNRKNKKLSEDQLKKNRDAIGYYIDTLNGDDDNALNVDPLTSGIKLTTEPIAQLGDRYFKELTGEECFDINTNDNVTRSIYINNRPDSGGIVGGLKQHIKSLDVGSNTTALLNAMEEPASATATQKPVCRKVTCEIIDNDTTNNATTGTETSSGYIAYDDMVVNQYPSQCTTEDASLYTTYMDNIGNINTLDSTGLTTDLFSNTEYDTYLKALSYDESFSNIKTKIDQSKMPKDKMIKTYYGLLSFLGLYLIYNCIILKSHR